MTFKSLAKMCLPAAQRERRLSRSAAAAARENLPHQKKRGGGGTDAESLQFRTHGEESWAFAPATKTSTIWFVLPQLKWEEETGEKEIEREKTRPKLVLFLSSSPFVVLTAAA